MFHYTVLLISIFITPGFAGKCTEIGQYSVNGSCYECPPGFHGFNCSKICPSGFYGNLCTQVCRCTTKQICDHMIGCIPDCSPGFHGSDSSKICPSGYYGNRCTQVCRCSTTQICDHKTGCIKAYQEDTNDPGCPLYRSCVSSSGIGVEQRSILTVISISVGLVCLLSIAALIVTCMKLKRQRKRPQRGDITQSDMEVIDNRTLYSGVNSGDEDDDKPYITFE